MLEVQKWLHDNNGDFRKLENQLAIKANYHPNDSRVILNYSQIGSPKTNSIVRECRGLVLCSSTYSLVARAFTRFFNWGEVREEMDDFDFNSCYGFHKEDGCFPYKTPIKLYDGTYLYIGDIVTKNLKPTVVGIDKNGNIVPSKVISWSRKPNLNNWLEFSIKRPTGHIFKFRTTTNHGINIGNKYIPAKELEIGDTLYHLYKKPSDCLLHVIKSGLLGDGSLTKNGKGYKYSESHKIKHEEYINELIKTFGECAISKDYRISGYGTKMVRCITKTYIFLESIRNEWYKNDIKCLPSDLSWIDNYTIAKWYMDDGCLSKSKKQKDRILFHTENFELNDVKRLCCKLKEMFNVNAVPQLNKKCNKYYIRVNAGKNNEIDFLFSKIEKYIVPCMRYKLPKKYKNNTYYPRLIGSEVFTTLKCKVVKIDNKSKKYKNGNVGFDIQTTTENYFAKNILVHNSLILGYHYNGSWHFNTRNSFSTGQINDTNLTWRYLINSALPDLFFSAANKKLTYVFELCSPYNKIVRSYSKPQLYLLSCFNGKYELPHLETYDESKRIGCEFTKYYQFPSIHHVERYLDNKRKEDRTFEGLVLRDKNNNRWKVKSPDYVALHRLANNGNVTIAKLVEIIMKGEIEETITYFPELESEIRRIKNQIDKLWQEVDNLWFCHWDEKSQKKFALAVKDHPLSGILFRARKDGVHPRDYWTVENLLRVLK